MDINIELAEIKKASGSLFDAAMNAERLGDRLARVSSNIIDRCYQQGGTGRRSYSALMEVRWQVVELKRRAEALAQAVQIYSEAEESLRSKSKAVLSVIGAGYCDEWNDQAAIGAIAAISTVAVGSIALTIEELYPAMGQFLFASYRDGEEYTTNTWDHIKYGVYNVFDVFESEALDKNGYQYQLYRSTLEDAIKESVNEKTSGLEGISDYLKDGKDIKTVAKYLERMAELVKKGEKKLLPESFTIAPYLEDFDASDPMWSYADWMKRTKEIYGVIEPLWTDYSKNIAVLESLKNVNCFDNDELQNQIVDDMINDYKNKFIRSLKNASQGLTDFSYDIAKTALSSSFASVAYVKLIDTTIDFMGIVTGDGKYADYIEEYMALTPALQKTGGAYTTAYKKMMSGNFLASDKQDFENLFNLNKQLTLKHLEVEKKILEHKDPGGYADRIELLDKRINRLNRVVLEDRSTWLHGDTWPQPFGQGDGGGGFR